MYCANPKRNQNRVINIQMQRENVKKKKTETTHSYTYKYIYITNIHIFFNEAKLTIAKTIVKHFLSMNLYNLYSSHLRIK